MTTGNATKENGLQNRAYTKLQQVAPFFISLVEDIKKPLKKDLLRDERGIAKRFFAGQQIDRLTSVQLAQDYLGALSSADEELAEQVVTYWLLAHTDLYELFAQELAQLNIPLEEIEEIEAVLAQSILKKACPRFGALNTYLFAILNEVRFGREILDFLHTEAQQQVAQKKQSQQDLEEAHTIQALQRQIERYEEKLAGLQKRYLKDTTLLKQQISKLQRQRG